MPYAPERLSITQDVLTPSMQEALAMAAKHSSARNSSSLRLPSGLTKGGAQQDGPNQPPEPPPDEEHTGGNTLFAALKMRKALQRAKTGSERQTEKPERVDQAQADIDRHVKVLSLYKIRRVDITETETRDHKQLGFLLVNPHSTLYKLWQLSTLVLIIYQSIILPYSLAFGWNQNSIIDSTTNAVFFFDIVIAFNTPLSVGDSDERDFITDRKEIALKYVTGWFFFDLLACIPFDSLLLWINNYQTTGTTNLNVLGLLKALRIPRLLRLVRLLRVVKVLKIRPEIRRWLQYSRHANLLRLVRLVLSFLVVNHYVACIWFGGIASDELKNQETNQDAGHMYIVSFYITLLVIMGQNITLYTDAEYLFCIAAMLLGAIVMAVVFGNVAILIANYYENQSNHQKKMEWLFASMTRMKLPMELQNRINDYYQAMWERHGTLDGTVTAFIPELSRNLAYEVELFLRMDMINRAPIFQSCSAKVVQELVMELELQVFMPGDYIVVRGEVGNDMYFVQNGLCEVIKDIAPNSAASFNTVRRGTVDVSANEIVLKTLGQGDYFGEIALLMNCKRTANVRAQVFSELCALTREVFENISLRYLEDRNIIEKFIMGKYDPGMLQAALKQSQELTMRNGGNGGPRPSIFKRSVTPSHDNDALEMLRRIEERLQKLEMRIDRESQERRESDGRQVLAMQQQHRLSTHSEDERLQGKGYHDAGEIGFEPERMSQRHLLSSIHRSSSKASQITNIQTGNVDTVIDGEATDGAPDEKRQVWRRPSVHRLGSWRNARREGSADSLRLRGLAKPQAATTARHTSRAASLTAAIAAAEAVSVHHSMLRREPSLRAESTAITNGLMGGTDPDQDGDMLSADSLDDLATTFAQNEQRES